MTAETAAEGRRRILLLGWDAADWKIIHPLAESGKLPFLSQLIERGTIGDLETLEPILSPILWSSIATGKTADRHGILGFTEPRPDGTGIRPVSSGSRRCKALWNMLNDRGLRASAVGWYASHPAEALDGVAVSNLVQRARGPRFEEWPLPEGVVHPASAEGWLAPLRMHPSDVSPEQILALVPRAAELEADERQPLAMIAKGLAELFTLHAIGTHLAEHEDFDLLAIYFDAIDRFCHRFMRFRPPRLEGVDERQAEIFGGVVDGIYRIHDLLLGRYMNLVGPETTILIVSDHGFHADHHRPPVHTTVAGEGPVHQHSRQGVFLASGPGIRKDELIHGAGLLDVAPTILYALGLPVARDLDGRVLQRIFEDEREPEWIDTYEDGAEMPRTSSGSQAEDIVAQEAALEQLVALGYIEPADAGSADAVRLCRAQRLSNLGTVLLSKGAYREALGALEEAAEHETFASARLRLAFCHLQLGEREACRGIVSGALEEEPDSPNARYLHAVLLLREGRRERGLDTLRNLEHSGNAPPELQVSIGSAYLRERQWRDAERVFAAHLEDERESPSALHGLGLARCGLSRPEEGIHALMQSVVLKHQQPRAHLHLGIALASVGRVHWAIRALEIAAEQDPALPRIEERLAQLYAAIGEPARAAALRDQVASRKPPDVAESLAAELERILGFQTLGAEAAPADSPLLVSGLPRSGTSMMMQMLAASGVPVLVDDERPADEDNPRGYYELSAVKATLRDASWLEEARGRAVKVVATFLPSLPNDRFYRVILMRRDLEEVVASQRKMRERLGMARKRSNPQAFVEGYHNQLASLVRWLRRQSNFRVLILDYEEVLADAARAAREVARFVDVPADEAAMAAAVAPELRRQVRARARQA